MPASNTYEAIESITLTTGSSNVTFSSIPQTYTDLVAVVDAISDGTYANFNFRVNGDSGSNYSRTRLSGSGSSATSARASSQTSFFLADVSGISNTGRSFYIVNFMNYANTTTYKTVLSRTNTVNGNAGDGVELHAQLWRSTSAINEISFLVSSFASGSTFTLYGIKAA
jgi:hypothetical protein